MRKYNKIAIIITGALSFSGFATANDIESGSLNKALSDTRIAISLQMMENKKLDAELEGIRKQMEIKQIKEQLEGNLDVNTTTTQVNKDIDYSVRFDETLNEEDILSENNNWEQNIGFIYEDDISLTSPVSSLTTQPENDAFVDLITAAMDSIDEEETDEVASSSISNNEFKLTTISLSKLTLYGESKEAEVKAQFIVDNGFQKISGSKIVKVKEGQKFNVKNEVFFEVKTISEEGVSLINSKTKELVIVQK